MEKFHQWLLAIVAIFPMKIGDLVLCHPSGVSVGHGIIVGFAKKGEGGKDFVDVLLSNGDVMTFMSFDIEVMYEKQDKRD